MYVSTDSYRGCHKLDVRLLWKKLCSELNYKLNRFSYAFELFKVAYDYVDIMYFHFNGRVSIGSDLN